MTIIYVIAGVIIYLILAILFADWVIKQRELKSNSVDWSKNDHTFGELYQPAVSVLNTTEAIDFLTKLIDLHLRKNPNTSAYYAMIHEMRNITSYAKRCDREAMIEVDKLYNAGVQEYVLSLFAGGV